MITKLESLIFLSLTSTQGGSNREDGYRLHCRENRSLLDRIAILQLQILSTEASAVPGMKGLRITGRPSDAAGLKAMALALSAEGKGGVQT